MNDHMKLNIRQLRERIGCECATLECLCTEMLKEAYKAGVEYMTLDQDDAYRNFRNGYRAGRESALKEATAKATEGGCACYHAPCEHDEAGEVIAERIRRIEVNPDALFEELIEKARSGD